MVEDLVPTEEDKENVVLVEAISHFGGGLGDGAYEAFDAQAELQKLMAEHMDLRKRVSILEDDMRMLKEKNVPFKENFAKQRGEVGGSQEIGDKVATAEGVKDAVKSDPQKVEEVVDSVGCEQKDIKLSEEYIKRLFRYCTHEKHKHKYVYKYLMVFNYS